MDDEFLRQSTGKRTRDEEDVKITVRSLIDSKSSGGIIGKGGEIIKKLREDSGAWIDIGDSVRGAANRVVSVKGVIENVVSALHMVAQRMQEIAQKEDESANMKSVLIIPEGQVGCIIGKGGVMIKALREQSGAQVKMSDAPLEGSTEKTLVLSGESDQVHSVLALVCHQLYENRDRSQSRVTYSPGGGALGGFGGGYGGSHPHSGGYGGGGMGYGSPPGGGGGGYAPYGGGGNTGYGGGPASAAQEEQQCTILVPVPEHMIGVVIGKGGANIKDVRLRSRAHVKVADRDPNGADVTDRIISVTGTRQARDIAVHLILEKQSLYDPTQDRRRGNGGGDGTETR